MPQASAVTSPLGVVETPKAISWVEMRSHTQGAIPILV